MPRVTAPLTAAKLGTIRDRRGLSRLHEQLAIRLVRNSGRLAGDCVLVLEVPRRCFRTRTGCPWPRRPFRCPPRPRLGRAVRRDRDVDREDAAERLVQGHRPVAREDREDARDRPAEAARGPGVRGRGHGADAGVVAPCVAEDDGRLRRQKTYGAAHSAAAIPAGRLRRHRLRRLGLMHGDDCPTRSGHRPPGDLRGDRAEPGGRRHRVGPRDGPVGSEAQELGGPELRDRDVVAIDDDVPQVAGDHLDGGGAAGGGQRRELAGRAGDPYDVIRGLPCHSARGRTRRSPGDDRSACRVDRRQHPASSQRHVDAARAVLRQPPRLVARLKRDRELQGLRPEVDHVDRVPVGIGRDRVAAIMGHEERSSGDRRGRRAASDGRPEIGHRGLRRANSDVAGGAVELDERLVEPKSPFIPAGPPPSWPLPLGASTLSYELSELT